MSMRSTEVFKTPSLIIGYIFTYAMACNNSMFAMDVLFAFMLISKNKNLS